jgi:hypothetical protein
VVDSGNASPVSSSVLAEAATGVVSGSLALVGGAAANCGLWWLADEAETLRRKFTN